MSLDEKTIEVTLHKWQKALFLRDWTVRVEVVPEGWRKSGDIKIDPNNRFAVLMVNETVKPAHLDEVVVHELVHLRLHPIDRITEDLLVSVYGDDDEDARRRFAYGQFTDHLETTTQELTRALLALDGEHDLMVSPHIDKAVAKERDPE